MAPHIVRLSPEAAKWLKAEISYIADRNPAAAQKIANRLRAARETLADYPMVGPEGWIPGTRRVLAGPYVLTIRVRGQVVEIAAIRHARQGDAYAPAEMPMDDDIELASEGF